MMSFVMGQIMNFGGNAPVHWIFAARFSSSSGLRMMSSLPFFLAQYWIFHCKFLSVKRFCGRRAILKDKKKGEQSYIPRLVNENLRLPSSITYVVQ